MQDTGSLSAVNENALETCEYGLAGVSLTSAAEYPHLASLEAQGRQQSPPPPTLQCPSLASFTTGNTAATGYKPIDTSQGCRSATVHAVSHLLRNLQQYQQHTNQLRLTTDRSALPYLLLSVGFSFTREFFHVW